MTDGIEALKTALPTTAWTQDADIIAPHLVEWRDKYQGETPLMLTPRSTAEVADTRENLRRPWLESYASRREYGLGRRTDPARRSFAVP